ncbi:protein SpAN-like [Portunus trituberculatus]|uniref:Metalloendopeptidase n=1 Tax=Portunus trituberculatus TaxID=210409 RepID=A0A5B7G6Q9_PORTR|nr:protein SpAN-like [Portunus trituberculatus]MPC54622.1 Tolloid-like protein 1 [Portunus trituberculatus]
MLLSRHWLVVVAAAALLGARRSLQAQDNMRREDHLRWPGGEVTFHLGRNLTGTVMANIREVIEGLESVTCLKFSPLVGRRGGRHTTKVLYIRQGRSCYYEKVGRRASGSVLLKLGDRCAQRPTAVLHMFLHVVGVRHEHQRYDRNYYVTVDHHNILPSHTLEYIRRSWGVSYVASAGLPYDYASIMHHAAKGHPRDSRRPVMLPLVPCAQLIMGQRDVLSPADVARLNRLYGCKRYYLGDDIIGAVPYATWRRRALRLRRLEDHRRW